MTKVYWATLNWRLSLRDSTKELAGIRRDGRESPVTEGVARSRQKEVDVLKLGHESKQCLADGLMDKMELALDRKQMYKGRATL